MQDPGNRELGCTAINLAHATFQKQSSIICALITGLFIGIFTRKHHEKIPHFSRFYHDGDNMPFADRVDWQPSAASRKTHPRFKRDHRAGSACHGIHATHSIILYEDNQLLSESIQSMLLLRGVKGAPPSIDLAFNLNINAIHTAGVFTRTFNTYGILLQTLVKEKLRFGYVFELPTNKSVGTQFTSHEISVGVLLSVFSFHEKSLSNF
jgi:hypothetical protein